jgi:hypothetical protein
MRPSNRIEVLARKMHGTYVTEIETGMYVRAIMAYLDENPPPVYSIQPAPNSHENCTIISQGDTAEHPKEKP